MGPRAFKLRPPSSTPLWVAWASCARGELGRKGGCGGGGNEKLRESGRWWFQLRRNCRRHHQQDLTFSAAANPLFCDKLREGKQNKMGKYRWGGREGEGAEPGAGQRLLLVQPENSCDPTSPKRKSRRRRRRTHNKHTPPQPPRSRSFELLILIPPKHNGGSLTWSKAIRSETFV